jgi:hypothetical protein
VGIGPKIFLRTLALAALSLAATGCSTVLFVRTPGSRIFTPPIYESNKAFFFFGLVGPEYDFYIDKICLGKTIDQIATEYTPGNVLTAVITLGIYTPRTAEIWCQL